MQLTSLSLALTRAGLLTLQWTPMVLFANNEPGVWYDPSDMATLFADAAGTTPVTAVEQPVGLMLDKSKGLVLGPELVTNGDFSNGTTGWSAGGTAATASISVVDGWMRVTKTAGSVYPQAFQILAVTTGTKFYKVTCEYRNPFNRQVFVSFSGTDRNFGTASSGTLSFVTTASTNVFQIGLRETSGNAGDYIEFDNVSVRELPGNHAFQTTSTSRPVLSRRVNLLTKTEQFDDGVWTKQNASITPNTTTAPDGTLTADSLIENSANAWHRLNSPVFNFAGTYTLSVAAKANTRGWLAFTFYADGFSRITYFNLTNGTIGTNPSGSTATITSLGDGWYRCSVTRTLTASTHQLILAPSTGDNGFSYTGDGTSGIYIWGASLVPADQASIPYQRVNTATDYDSDPTKFPAYLKGDSVSGRAMVTNTITPGTDKVQVFAGVRKLSDDASGMLLEWSANNNTNAGSFFLLAPGSLGVNGNYETISRGNAATLTDQTARSATTRAPVTNVFTAIHDIPVDLSAIRLNGAASGTNGTADKGAGNFLTYPLYLFARNQSSIYFTGHLYSMIVRFGPNLPTATIEAAEKFVANKTGISLT
jgi:hypothetical protein